MKVFWVWMSSWTKQDPVVDTEHCRYKTDDTHTHTHTHTLKTRGKIVNSCSWKQMFYLKMTVNKHLLLLCPGCCGSLGWSIIHSQGATGLIPGQGTFLGCGFNPQLGRVWEAIDWCFSLVSTFLFLPYCLPSSISKAMKKCPRVKTENKTKQK